MKIEEKAKIRRRKNPEEANIRKRQKFREGQNSEEGKNMEETKIWRSQKSRGGNWKIRRRQKMKEFQISASMGQEGTD